MNRIAAILALTLAAPAAHGATFIVTRTDDPAPDGCLPNDCSLREAIRAANDSRGSDRIELPAGTFTLSFPATALGEVTLVATDNVQIVGRGAGATRIRSAGDGQMFRVSHAALALENLSVLNGRAGGANPTGGAIRAFGSKLVLVNAVLSGHQAESMGGAIEMHYSTLDMSGSEISGNASGAWGGGIAAFYSSVEMLNGSTISGNTAVSSAGGLLLSQSDLIGDDTSAIRDNQAPSSAGASVSGSITGMGTPGGSGLFEISNNRTTGSSGSGGGLSISGTAVVSRVALLDNQAHNGGGLSASSGTPVLTDSLIAANHASSTGGGVYLGSQASLRLERVSIEGNSASNYGGAVRMHAGTLTLANVDIHDNVAPERAAISNHSGRVTLRHATITANTSGHAHDVLWLGADATASYANSILAGRCTGNSAGLAAQGRNLRTTSFLGGNCPGTTATTAQLALRRDTFGGLFEVSGTGNPASVLIDHGSSGYCLPTDIRGAARDLRCDTGAFEYGARMD